MQIDLSSLWLNWVNIETNTSTKIWRGKIFFIRTLRLPWTLSFSDCRLMYFHNWLLVVVSLLLLKSTRVHLSTPWSWHHPNVMTPLPVMTFKMFLMLERLYFANVEITEVWSWAPGKETSQKFVLPYLPHLSRGVLCVLTLTCRLCFPCFCALLLACTFKITLCASCLRLYSLLTFFFPPHPLFLTFIIYKLIFTVPETLR